MRYSLRNRISSRREPLAMEQTWQVRVEDKVLTERGFPASSFECVDSRKHISRGFAQSSIYNVVKHNVVSGL